MELRLAFLVLSVLWAAVVCDDDGQYKPERYKGDDGKYKPDNEGKYVHIPDGRGDGKYVKRREGNVGRFNPGFVNRQPTTNSGGSGFRNLLSNPTRFASPGDFFINRFIVDEASSNLSPSNSRLPSPIAVNLLAPSSIVQTKQYSVPPKEISISESKQSPNAGPTTKDGQSRILRQDVAVGPDGYHFLYETDNSIIAEEDGRLISQTGSGKNALVATGFYEYLGPDNVKYRVDYIADENGFQPLGVHLPTPPPIPIEIQRILVEKDQV